MSLPNLLNASDGELAAAWKQAQNEQAQIEGVMLQRMLRASEGKHVHMSQARERLASVPVK